MVVVVSAVEHRVRTSNATVQWLRTSGLSGGTLIVIAIGRGRNRTVRCWRWPSLWWHSLHSLIAPTATTTTVIRFSPGSSALQAVELLLARAVRLRGVARRRGVLAVTAAWERQPTSRTSTPCEQTHRCCSSCYRWCSGSSTSRYCCGSSAHCAVILSGEDSLRVVVSTVASVRVDTGVVRVALCHVRWTVHTSMCGGGGLTGCSGRGW